MGCGERPSQGKWRRRYLNYRVDKTIMDGASSAGRRSVRSTRLDRATATVKAKAGGDICDMCRKESQRRGVERRRCVCRIVRQGRLRGAERRRLWTSVVEVSTGKRRSSAAQSRKMSRPQSEGGAITRVGPADNELFVRRRPKKR